MGTRANTHRLITLALLLFYLPVAGWGQYVDAVLEAEAAAHAVGHGGADEDGDCAPAHHDLICQLARLIGGTGARTGAAVPQHFGAIRRAALPPAADADFETVAVPPVGTRAPPLL